MENINIKNRYKEIIKNRFNLENLRNNWFLIISALGYELLNFSYSKLYFIRAFLLLF